MQADTAQKELKLLSDETGMFGSITDEEIAANTGKTYQDVTALRDPLAGLALSEGDGTDEAETSERPFDTAAQDAAVMDYNPYRDPKTGRYTNGPGGASTKGGSRGKLVMSNTERHRVSSGILTDHPNLKPGDVRGYFYGQYYYRFSVDGPGEYNFHQRIRIEGNKAYIDRIEMGWKK